MSRFRRAAAVGVVTALLGGGAFVISRYLWPFVEHRLRNDQCVAEGYGLDLEQAAIASDMVAVVLRRRLPMRAAELLIAAGLQESKLRNLSSGEGDRDSVGVLQQRPSQGWGTVAQIGHVSYAANRFLDELLRDPRWQSESLSDAIQEVQRSADGSAYAKHEAAAEAWATALMGVRPAGVSCQYDRVIDLSVRKRRNLMQRLPGSNLPSMKAHSMSLPHANWAQVAWLVAHGEEIGIRTIDFRNRHWNNSDGWQVSQPSTSALVVSMG